MDIATSLHRLVPSAEYIGSTTSNTQDCYDSLTWQDPRPKPSWGAIVTSWQELSLQNKWDDIDKERNRLINKHKWRIERYQTQKSADLTTTETHQKFIDICVYFQKIRDLPETYPNPDDIIWPVEP